MPPNRLLPVVSRKYQRSDLSRIKALLNHSVRLYGPVRYFHIGDVLNRLYDLKKDFDASKNIRLWEDAQGELLGFAWFDPPRYGNCFPKAGLNSAELEREMLVWLEQRAVEEGGSDAVLELDVFARDAERGQFLFSRGYEITERFYRHYQRDLSKDIPEPMLPEGFRLESMATYSAPVELIKKKGFDPERYQRLMAAPGYIPDLDLAILSNTGEVASCCFGWVDEVTAIGEVEPIWTEPAYQRQGLARSILQECLRRLRERNMSSVIVTTGGLNENAYQLYTSLGFTELDRSVIWIKKSLFPALAV